MELTKDQVMLLGDAVEQLHLREKACRNADLNEIEARRHLVLLYAVFLNIPAEDLALGNWWCKKSNIRSSCVYNDKTDINHDSCLFCGQPEERK